MDIEVIETIVCSRCRADVDSRATACPRCGAAIAIARPRSLEAIDRGQIWLHDRRYVLLLVLGAMGALGLPLLWLSHGLSLKEKIFWSVIAVLETILLVALAWYSISMLVEAVNTTLQLR